MKDIDEFLNDLEPPEEENMVTVHEIQTPLNSDYITVPCAKCGRHTDKLFKCYYCDLRMELYVKGEPI